jgi:hypothetical protein
MRTVSVGAVLALLLSATWIVSVGDQPGQAAPVPAKFGPVPALDLELKHLTLENVDDKAGRWQFEGGQVFQKGKHVANYATVRRVVNKGTEEQNTAMLTTTIFFLGKQPPENMTLQGAHDYNSRDQTGSVSAASGQYAAYIGKAFSTTRPQKITIK